MYTKLFVTLFFRQKKFLLLFLFLVSASSYFIVKQVNEVIKKPQEIEIPDIEFLENLQKDAVKTELGQEEIEGFLNGLKEIAGKKTEIYHMITRNLYTFSSPFYQVSFELYGADQEFFYRFENHLASGTIPRHGENEVLVGSNAASFYQLEVGDCMNEKLEMFADTEEKEYLVSGIIDKSDSYFGNEFYVLREDFQKLNQMQAENKILIYVSGKQTYKNIINYIKEQTAENEFGEYIDNYKEKLKRKNQPVKKLRLTLIGSLLLLELVYLYMSKGLDKKAGIIKALGIPDGRVLAICSLFFGGLILLTTAAVFILSLILFDIGQKFLISLLLVIGIVTFLILFLEIAVKYKKISPRESMPAK